MFNWLRRREGSESARPAASLGPIARYEASGRRLANAPVGTQELLRLAEEAHQRRHSDPEHDAPPKKKQTGLPITGNDDAVLAMLAGAQFAPSASVELRSGTTLSGAEAQTWTDLYDPERER